MVREPFSSTDQTDLEAAPPSPWERVKERAVRLRGRGSRVVLFASGVAAALIAVLIYQALTPAPQQLTTKDVNASIASAFASATPQPAFSALVYQVIRPSLVLIQAESPGGDGSPESSIGSGVIINDQGDILTAFHVVEGSQKIELTFADGSQSSGQVTASEPENDIAVLNADTPPQQIVPATLGNPGAMNIGDEAFAVGNPFGLYSSMSAGVISGFGRSFQTEGSEVKLENLIQIDAAVNPGNSGGPLLNRYGEVIGIVTGLVNPSKQNFFVGVGFAVPITTAAPAAGAPDY
jgi:S1-C subfamily serine protease